MGRKKRTVRSDQGEEKKAARNEGVEQGSSKKM
jgi:hypothetical protein